jgi:hypothetical protein
MFPHAFVMFQVLGPTCISNDSVAMTHGVLNLEIMHSLSVWRMSMLVEGKPSWVLMVFGFFSFMCLILMEVDRILKTKGRQLCMNARQFTENICILSICRFPFISVFRCDISVFSIVRSYYRRTRRESGAYVAQMRRAKICACDVRHANVARTCRARNAQQGMLLLDPSVYSGRNIRMLHVTCCSTILYYH